MIDCVHFIISVYPVHDFVTGACSQISHYIGLNGSGLCLNFQYYYVIRNNANNALSKSVLGCIASKIDLRNTGLEYY